MQDTQVKILELDRLTLRPKEARKILGISEYKLYELMNQGEIPYFKAGAKCTLIPYEGLKEWTERRTANAKNKNSTNISPGSC